jgi:hypothetical protein
VAARSTVGNLIAGLQIAFAGPIRLDDAVVVEGEWGNIEEITLADRRAAGRRHDRAHHAVARPGEREQRAERLGPAL